MTISILIADDHKIVRQGLRALLQTQPEYEVVSEANDGAEALNLIEMLEPDVVFLDMMMPKLNGIEVMRQLNGKGLKTRVIFLSMHANPSYIVKGLQAGALGYVLKDSGFAEIMEAIQQVMKERRYVSREVMDSVLEMLLKSDVEKLESLSVLSPREQEILILIAAGKTNAIIAEQLALSVRTIEAHRSHIMAKLRFSSQAELVRYAVQ